jgi:hypothetical protein
MEEDRGEAKKEYERKRRLLRKQEFADLQRGASRAMELHSIVDGQRKVLEAQEETLRSLREVTAARKGGLAAPTPRITADMTLRESMRQVFLSILAKRPLEETLQLVSAAQDYLRVPGSRRTATEDLWRSVSGYLPLPQNLKDQIANLRAVRRTIDEQTGAQMAAAVSSLHRASLRGDLAGVAEHNAVLRRLWEAATMGSFLFRVCNNELSAMQCAQILSMEFD